MAPTHVRRPLPVRLAVPTALGLATCLPSHVLAQDGSGSGAPTTPPPMVPAVSETRHRPAREENLSSLFKAGAIYQFDTDIDDGGEFDVLRAGGVYSTSFDLDPNNRLRFSVGYRWTEYGFNANPGETGLGMTDPWDTIHTVQIGVSYVTDLSDDFSLAVSPFAELSGETGASFSDTFSGGIIGSLIFRAEENLTLSLGVGVQSQIEDSARFFPAISVEWEIAERLRLTGTGSGASLIGPTGIELEYDLDDAWAVALGGRYEHLRFRLDEDNVAAPDGIGQDEGFPIWGRLTYDWGKGDLTFFAGGMFWGELTLEDAGGNELVDTDYDPAGFIGINFRVRF